jgi:M6 family metalloprotease-like protein
MADPVRLRVPRQALFVGSFAPIAVEIDPAAGVGFDDLVFSVTGGPAVGRVSVARERGFEPQRPSVMLLAGWQPGRSELVVTHAPSGAVVGRARFSTTDVWRDDVRGPRLWFDGENPRREAGAAWGGGPVGPQNIAVVPALGTRRIAVLLVDTSSQRFDTDASTLQGAKDRWLAEIVGGVPAADGSTRSTRIFYREVSYGNFDLTAQVFGPASLPADWDTYFNADGTPKGSYFQACFTAGDSLIDYRNFDTLLCVAQGVPATATVAAKSAWPYASIGNWGPFTTSDGNLPYGVVSMPNEWGATNDREVHETFSHELGHNLGLGDQYNPAVAGRNPGAWEMMHADDPFPHFSIAHRMMLGWVHPEWIRSFDFSVLGAPINEPVRLHPIELGEPPAGRMAGIEVRVTDGLNYYFEYRRGQAAQTGDRGLPLDGRVLGTDIASPPYTPPFARPTVLLLPTDLDGDGPVLGDGQDYRQTDNTTTGFPADFRAEVSSVTADKADVRVRYGVIGKPDPSIRPWPAGPDRPWQSPDIEVRNARNSGSPEWFNVPWEGNPNTIIARIRNSGAIDAPAVRVEFFVKNYNVGGNPEVVVGTDTRDVPAGSTVEFQAPWVPPSQGHFCVVVRIPLYQLPGGAAVEMTELNNIAQSNYDRFISRTASPPSREETTVEVGNPYNERTRVFMVGGQSNPLYRTYLDSTWFWLEPGETRKVRVMLESMIEPGKGPPEGIDGRTFEKHLRRPNDIGLAAFVEDPHDNPRHALWLLGGAQAQVATGRTTEFVELRADREAVRGSVRAVDDRSAVPSGRVVVTLARGRGRARTFANADGVVQNGAFSVRIGGEWETATAYYVPIPGFADCSGTVPGPAPERTAPPRRLRRTDPTQRGQGRKR